MKSEPGLEPDRFRALAIERIGHVLRVTIAIRRAS